MFVHSSSRAQQIGSRACIDCKAPNKRLIARIYPITSVASVERKVAMHDKIMHCVRVRFAATVRKGPAAGHTR
ncbi:MAG TPA: hypothetical protein DDZ51_03615 [Planctomycetaceae bacterium]|nr:hypothetical protein [Planctomycetaceae bacterium]